MAGHDIIVLGASAGGVEVLRELMRGLPPGLPASLFVVCHFPAGGRSALPEILSRAGPLLATHPRDGEPTYPGQVYVAPPDFHLLLEPGRARLSRGPRENRQRPSIDALFRSAARAYGPRVVAVVLSGALQDGTAGLMAVRQAGGVAVVQDPGDALVTSMPLTAREIAGADHSARAAELAPLLVELVHSPVPPRGGPSMADPSEKMPGLVARDMEGQRHGEREGEISTFTCPECGGSLWQLDQAGVLQFRCHVGHAYHSEVLLEEQRRALEAALWTAVRTYREKAVLSRQLAARTRAQGDDAGAQRFEEEAHVADQYGELIRNHVLRPEDAKG
jgi:two-component system, chemotaxis family, protein-glutamate methylesterase/glutaminase